jgi:hypothetical protein
MGFMLSSLKRAASLDRSPDGLYYSIIPSGTTAFEFGDAVAELTTMSENGQTFSRGHTIFSP